MRSIKKGEIYLANLGNKNEFDIGKVRPVVIFQNDFLNRMLSEAAYSDVVILPLSSQIRQSDFSYFMAARDALEKDSIIVCNAIKMIDAQRVLVDKGLLTTLNAQEIIDIEDILYNLLGCRNRG